MQAQPAGLRGESDTWLPGWLGAPRDLSEAGGFHRCDPAWREAQTPAHGATKTREIAGSLKVVSGLVSGPPPRSGGDDRQLLG